MKGRGGFWNRAGRRSGGSRPVEIHVPPVSAERYQCPSCGNDMLPMYITSGCEPCRWIVELHRAGRIPDEYNLNRGEQ